MSVARSAGASLRASAWFARSRVHPWRVALSGERGAAPSGLPRAIAGSPSLRTEGTQLVLGKWPGSKGESAGWKRSGEETGLEERTGSEEETGSEERKARNTSLLLP